MFTRINTSSEEFHKILPDNLAESVCNGGLAAGDDAESQKQSTGHKYCPGSHGGVCFSFQALLQEVFLACVFIDDHKKGSHLMSTGRSCGRRAKAISVTLHGHRSRRQAYNFLTDLWSLRTTTTKFCVCVLSKDNSDKILNLEVRFEELIISGS